jgi:trehalose utilization protein
MMKVTVWNEFVHEQSDPQAGDIYPDGIHGAIAHALRDGLGEQASVRTATLKEPEHGLNETVLAETDVLFWWGHAAHDQVDDAVVNRVVRRVLEGMGMIALHSAHDSKPFKKLMGTGCQLRWRENRELERLWIVDPGHPIVDGLGVEYFELPHTEMYGEPFGIPTPDELILISWFAGGEVFRSGCTFRRGKGKVFYFRPGHETYPIYHDRHVQQILVNATRWAMPTGVPIVHECRNII